MSTTVEVNYEALEALSISDLDLVSKRFKFYFEGCSHDQSDYIQVIIRREIDKRIKNIFTF